MLGANLLVMPPSKNNLSFRQAHKAGLASPGFCGLMAIRVLSDHLLAEIALTTCLSHSEDCAARSKIRFAGLSLNGIYHYQARLSAIYNNFY